MSRVGKQPIPLPEGVLVSIQEGTVLVKGPKGSLTVLVPPKASVLEKEGILYVSVADPTNVRQAAFWGLARSLVANAVHGVTQGFEKKLELNGVGYKVQSTGNVLVFNVGYSHAVEFPLPEGITGTVAGNIITVQGIDNQLLGEVAANIRKIRKPEPYKGKGIKYVDEVIRRKVGKVMKGSE